MPKGGAPSTLSEVIFGARTMEYNLLERLTAVLEKAARLGIAPSCSEMVQWTCLCVEFISNIGYPVSPDADTTLVGKATVALLVCINYELVKGRTKRLTPSQRGDSGGAVAGAMQGHTLRGGLQRFVEVERIHSRRLLIQLLCVQNDIVNFWALEVLKLLCCCLYAPRNVKQSSSTRPPSSLTTWCWR